MKRVFLLLMAVPLLMVGMMSCTGTKTDAKRLEGRWLITEVSGDNVVAERAPFMEFSMSDMKLHGNAGCNIFNTTFTLDPKDVSSIKINPAVTTMMACPDLDLERKILDDIESVAEVKENKNSNELLLTNKAGKVLFVLTKN